MIFDEDDNFDEDLSDDERDKIKSLIELINAAIGSTDGIGNLLNDLNTKRQTNLDDIKKLEDSLPTTTTSSGATTTTNANPSPGVLGNIDWGALAGSQNGVKFYFNEHSAVPESGDRVSSSGTNTSGVYRLPGAIINQTDFTGSTNVFSPIINMNKNVG